MIVIVAAKWRLTPKEYLDRYTYPELRLHFGAFAKEAMAPMAPIFAAFEGSGKGAGEGAQDRTAPRQSRRDGWMRHMPRWWSPKPGVDYSFIPRDASPAYMEVMRAKLNLGNMEAPRERFAM